MAVRPFRTAFLPSSLGALLAMASAAAPVGECAAPPFEVALDLAGNPAVSAPVRPDKAASPP